MQQLSVPVLLLVNYLTNPIGIGDPSPGLSWQMSVAGERRGIAQSAYEIQVSSRPDGPPDLWDSGRVEGGVSNQIAYKGRPLASRTRAYWRVTVWDESGVSASTRPGDAYWETGLLHRQDWTARWIGAPWHGAGQTSARAPFLRREFHLSPGTAQARLYISALGIYELYINGARVGEDRFTPGWTDYRRRVQYQVYDVTALLRPGTNVIGAILGDGWYAGHVAYRPREMYGDRPRLLVQLEVTETDGSREVINTDGSWRVGGGPLLEDDLLMGESYDARSETPGWLSPAFKMDGWVPAVEFSAPAAELSPMLDLPVRIESDVAPVSPPRKMDSGGLLFDFGQNLVGTVTLRVAAPAGTTVRLRYGEVLDRAGELYTENLRSARATDYYTCKGDPDGEVWSTRFTYHGFRYAEVSGLAGQPGPKVELVAHVLHSELPATGDFTCSDPLVNRLQRNIQWSQRGNYFEVPTDCPQRDERLGWTGDAEAFIRTGAWNRGIAPFFSKWQRDIADAQAPDGSVPEVVPRIEFNSGDGGPAWSDAAVICPWTIYQCYGDRALLSAHYAEMRRYVEYLGTESVDGIRLHPSLRRWGGFGDWLALDGSGQIDGGTPKDLIGTAFYAFDARIMAAVARALGKQADAVAYDALAAGVARAFQRRFVTADGLVAGNTQTGYALALDFDLAPAGLRARMADELVRDIRRRGNLLATGFVGTPHLLHALSSEGRLDVAYDLLLQRNWPSWLYPVTQGATTIWERWDGWTQDKGFEDKGMNSFNHYAYGAVGDWLYRVVAGVELDPLQPGYKHFFLQPRPGGPLTWARGEHDTPYGRIVSHWRTSAGTFEWDVEVPPNTTAHVVFPGPVHLPIREGGLAITEAAGISAVRSDGPVTCDLGSGKYRFTAAWPN